MDNSTEANIDEIIGTYKFTPILLKLISQGNLGKFGYIMYISSKIKKIAVKIAKVRVMSFMRNNYSIVQLKSP
jgi:hypothetical protein